MPEGLEKDVTIEQMADLLAFLRAALPAAKPKAFPGNKPAPAIRPAGRVAAAAGDCGRGLRLVAGFEPAYTQPRLLEQRRRPGVWTINVAAAGRYEVLVDTACPKEEAGKLFTVEVGGESVSGRVTATNGWEDYREEKVGELELKAGEARLTVRATPPFKGLLMDLRTVRLVPVKK